MEPVPSVNSARVAGGKAVAPLQLISPEPQSAVAQVPRPELSNWQPVLAQNLPDQPVGAWKLLELPFVSSKPVLPISGFPKIPGHTVKSHLFTKLNVAPETETPLKRMKMMKAQKG